MSAEGALSVSLKEAAVLSRLPEDRLRREVERGVIEPRVAPRGSAHRLRFDEPAIFYCALLHSLSGTVELAPATRTKTWRLLVASQPRNIRSRGADAMGRRRWAH